MTRPYTDIATGATKQLKSIGNNRFAETTVDATGQAGGTVVTSAAPFNGTATNLLVLQDISITSITAPGLTNASALVGQVLSAGVSLPASSITALTISSGIAVLYA